jgi:hypothetical protein
MFGFLEVSAAGDALERVVEALMASVAVPRPTGEPGVLQPLLDCTERLAQQVKAAGQASPSSAGMFSAARHGF